MSLIYSPLSFVLTSLLAFDFFLSCYSVRSPASRSTSCTLGFRSSHFLLSLRLPCFLVLRRNSPLILLLLFITFSFSQFLSSSGAHPLLFLVPLLLNLVPALPCLLPLRLYSRSSFLGLLDAPPFAFLIFAFYSLFSWPMSLSPFRFPAFFPSQHSLTPSRPHILCLILTFLLFFA